MPRYEVEIEGDDLAGAARRLNEAGIPTIASGDAASAASSDPHARSSIFRRSAAPWIIAVILIAFFAQRIISPPAEEWTYDQIVAQVESSPETIERAELDPEDTTITLIETAGDEHKSGYPPSSEEELVVLLREQQIDTAVEEGGGGSLIGLLLYVLPFLLILGFWVFLMGRMKRQGREGHFRHPARLVAVVEASSDQEAESQARRRLADVSAQTGSVRPS